MKICCFSDKHGRNVKLPKAYMLIYAGDMTNIGTEEELEEFIDWLKSLNYTYKICIAGNHDRCLEYDRTRNESPLLESFDFDYLNDTWIGRESGFSIYGSPITPPCFDWAFSLNDTQRELYWNKLYRLLPDILITHTGPYGILDQAYSGEHLGCRFLHKVVSEIRPKLHVFGHIHEAAGVISLKQMVEERGGKWNEKDQNTIFVNAYEPVVVDI
ncbi:MAG: metallophosphatase domain-containing protein [Candidatus Paceibacterota bacterium]